MLQTICKLCGSLATQSKSVTRHINTSAVRNSSWKSNELKKFYKTVSVSKAEDGNFEINLDSAKLRTPGGKLFKVPNELLALGVAQEWSSQTDTIRRSIMHMTTLCNTAIDNPTHRDPERMVKGILEYLDTDTIRFLTTDPDELFERQKTAWEPLLRHTEVRYDLAPESLAATTGMLMPVTSAEVRERLGRHVRGYNSFALIGFQNVTETLKSFILALALADRVLQVDEAVELSRLEASYQANRWGAVSWYHDVEVAELSSRVAAGLLLVHTGHEKRDTVAKQQKNAVM